MAYTPTTWVTGDTITAVKLNNMEQGIVDASIFFVETAWNATKGGYEILTPLADIATATTNERICKTIGDLHGRQITVSSLPWGGGGYLVTVDYRCEWYFDATPPTLNVYYYLWNGEILTEETFSYVLTPAT